MTTSLSTDSDTIETIEVETHLIPEGNPYRVSVGKRRGILFVRAGEGYNVFVDRCPHQGMSMRRGTIEDDVLVCPHHRFQFSVHDGSPLRSCPPATTLPFTLEGDRIVVDVDLDAIEALYAEVTGHER